MGEKLQQPRPTGRGCLGLRGSVAAAASASWYSRALLQSACPLRVWNGIFGAGDWPPKGARRRCLRRETGNRRPPHARNGHKNGLSASGQSVAGFGRLGGGRTRARTWDPLIKSQRLQSQVVSERPADANPNARAQAEYPRTSFAPETT